MWVYPHPLSYYLRLENFRFRILCGIVVDGGALNVVVPIVDGSKPFDSHLLYKICHLASNTFDRVLFVDEMGPK